MLLPEPSFVCIPSFRSVYPGVFWPRYQSLFPFFLDIGRGVAIYIYYIYIYIYIYIYLNHFPGETDS